LKFDIRRERHFDDFITIFMRYNPSIRSTALIENEQFTVRRNRDSCWRNNARRQLERLRIRACGKFDQARRRDQQSINSVPKRSEVHDTRGQLHDAQQTLCLEVVDQNAFAA